MNLILLALTALKIALDEATSSGAPQHIIDGIQAAITNLIAVHGSDVTFEQLEAMRTKKLW